MLFVAGSVVCLEAGRHVSLSVVARATTTTLHHHWPLQVYTAGSDIDKTMGRTSVCLRAVAQCTVIELLATRPEKSLDS